MDRTTSKCAFSGSFSVVSHRLGILNGVLQAIHCQETSSRFTSDLAVVLALLSGREVVRVAIAAEKQERLTLLKRRENGNMK